MLLAKCLSRTLGSLALRGGANAHLSILIFHRVVSEPETYYGEIDAQRFDQLVGFLANNFNVLPLAQALTRLESGQLPQRSICITFDDGYADNYHTALPILQRHGVPATFFIASGYLDGSWMWNDLVLEAVRTTGLEELAWNGTLQVRGRLESLAARKQVAHSVLQMLKYRPPSERDEVAAEFADYLDFRPPGALMMDPDDVRALHAAGMEIGGHTVRHPVLTTVRLDEARREIVQGRELLQKIIGEPVRFFAYPNGKPGRDYTREHVELVKELGFKAALSTAWGTTRRGTDRFQLPRFTPWDVSLTRFGLRLCQNTLRSTGLHGP